MSEYKVPFVIPVILCGGVGSRLWPVSRDLYPKPFIRLPDGQTLLQKTYLRGVQLEGVAEVITVTNRELAFEIRDEFNELGKGDVSNSLLLEPFGRNTAPAVVAAALYAKRRIGVDSILLVLPADHLVSDYLAFEKAVQEAIRLAQADKLVTFGIKPTSPETGFGYIESDGDKVLRFVEKPNKETAEAYVGSGRFLWNSGMFCFKASVILEEVANHCPDLLQAMCECMDQSCPTGGLNATQVELNSEAFKRVPDDSIDYAVMERSDRVAVVPCDIGWSDIGSWEALGNLIPKDASDNRIDGDVVLHAVQNCTIQSQNRLIGALGVRDLIIVDTPDALLVADKSRAQEVKNIYAQLKANGHDAHNLHRTVRRPWGVYTVLEESEGFKIKRIEVKPGASLSLQMHHHRSEHWVVVSGTAMVINGDREIIVRANESTYIPAGQKHRLHNPDSIPCVMIEVQCGSYLGEDDIVRFDDVYGRSQNDK